MCLKIRMKPATKMWEQGRQAQWPLIPGRAQSSGTQPRGTAPAPAAAHCRHGPVEDVGEGEAISPPSHSMGCLVTLVFCFPRATEMPGVPGRVVLCDPGSAKCQSAPSRLPREGGSAPSLPHTVLAPSPWALQPLCVGRLSLGEVPKVPTRNPEGGGPGWSELNFLSI